MSLLLAIVIAGAVISVALIIHFSISIVRMRHRKQWKPPRYD